MKKVQIILNRSDGETFLFVQGEREEYPCSYVVEAG